MRTCRNVQKFAIEFQKRMRRILSYIARSPLFD